MIQRFAFSSALAALAVTIAPAQARSSPFHDLAAIDDAVAAFTGAGIGQPGGAGLPVDRRLRLAACNSPLSLA